MHQPSLSNVVKVLRQPQLIPDAVNHFCVRANQSIHKRMQPQGTDVMAEDWDNLFILDACRYDLFKQVYDEKGELEKRVSKGSDSWGFIEKNFIGRELHDTVYITANPFASQIPNGTFHALINLLGTAWDDDAKTVRPVDVVTQALAQAEEYPEKRYIIHFMQPHYPFLGPTGDSISHAGLGEFDESGERNIEAQAHADDSTSVWAQLEFGNSESSADDVWQAYRENLEIVLPHAESLAEELGGLTVLTSDHGNLIGERTSPLPARGYGHPRNLFVPELIEVPWLILGGERREVKEDAPVRKETLDQDVVDDRLEHLGYF